MFLQTPVRKSLDPRRELPHGPKWISRCLRKPWRAEGAAVYHAVALSGSSQKFRCDAECDAERAPINCAGFLICFESRCVPAFLIALEFGVTLLLKVR